MKKHTKLYLSNMYPHHCKGEYIQCEVCTLPAVDIHHIKARGMGGGHKDEIENLMGLCRKCHNEYGDKTFYMKFLISTHFEALTNAGVEFDPNWFNY